MNKRWKMSHHHHHHHHHHAKDPFQEYLNKIKDIKDDKCWLCGKTPDQIRQEFYEYMRQPDREFDEIDLDDLIIMTYKTKKPICAACYFAIKRNPQLVREILERPEGDVWRPEE